ncbi:dihydrolipoamide acetyltransferase family protein [Mobilicoccus sp.]|uniref:dihydrolipoamide acetyltransferase family protein n=1 Tax=Mobilicoccus sp. TaxID=2034349 RepID=UPI00289FE614|nr:dihydrolipoamide acetyltransferase family protein [Mobilicoccus sp.]
MSVRTFDLPDLGEGLTEGEVISWDVAVGDTVAVDQIIAVVETAKAQVDLPCPFAGTVTTLHAQAGEVVDVGKPLISVEVAGTSSADTALVEDATERSTATQERMDEERAGSGNVLIGYGTSEAKRGRRRRVGRRPSSSAPAGAPAAEMALTLSEDDATPEPSAPSPVSTEGTSAADASTRGGRDEPGSRPGEAVRVISPLVRRLAREYGLDLFSVTPTAPGGIITRRDVEAARAARDDSGVGSSGESRRAAESVTSVASDATGPSAGGTTPTTATTGLRDERVPLTGIRRTIADRLSRSRSEIPDATTWVDVDATGLRSLKDDLAATVPDARIGYLALLARIVVAGLARFPELNASVDTEAGEIVRKGVVNLSLAAQGPRGLVVPVVHGASAMSTEQLSAAIRDVTGRARAGTLSPAEMTGGTFTLNNYGVYGVDGSTPIINHPEAGMLGVGRIVDKPWVVDGALAVRPVTQLSLSFDHRVCDGGVAGGFLRYVADCVERPGALLAGL